MEEKENVKASFWRNVSGLTIRNLRVVVRDHSGPILREYWTGKGAIELDNFSYGPLNGVV